MGDGRRAGRLQSTLVVAEVALAVVLVLGAGLTFRSLASLARVDLGVKTEELAALRFALPGARDMEFAEWQDVYRRMLDRVQAVPGVEEAGLSSAAPLSLGWQAGLGPAEHSAARRARRRAGRPDQLDVGPADLPERGPGGPTDQHRAGWHGQLRAGGGRRGGHP